MTRTLLFAAAGERAESWTKAFAEVAPEIDFRPHQPGEDVSDIPYCLVWRAAPGLWSAMKNVKIIFGLGAGVERLLADPSLPRDVPLVRMVEPALTRGMVEYVLWQSLFHHRKVWELEAAQGCATWRPHTYPAPWDRTIGILGLASWASRPRKSWSSSASRCGAGAARPSRCEGRKLFGQDQLPAFLAKTEILVCLLPLTSETRGILNASLFAQLPRGASVINAGRGGHLVEADLTAAMASGQVGAATLDVFETEPLPDDHPFWSTERLYITPHNASVTDPRSAAWRISRQIARYEAGEKLENVVDRARGY